MTSQQLTALLYRITAGCLIFFAFAHTVGGLFSKRGHTPARAGALAAMRSKYFPVMGCQRTYYDFYMGFGLLVSVHLLFSAVLAWQLAHLALQVFQLSCSNSRPTAVPTSRVPPVGLALRGGTGGDDGAELYFFAAPGVVSTLVAALSVLAALTGQ